MPLAVLMQIPDRFDGHSALPRGNFECSVLYFAVLSCTALATTVVKGSALHTRPLHPRMPKRSFEMMAGGEVAGGHGRRLGWRWRAPSLITLTFAPSNPCVCLWVGGGWQLPICVRTRLGRYVPTVNREIHDPQFGQGPRHTPLVANTKHCGMPIGVMCIHSGPICDEGGQLRHAKTQCFPETLQRRHGNRRWTAICGDDGVNEED